MISAKANPGTLFVTRTQMLNFNIELVISSTREGVHTKNTIFSVSTNGKAQIFVCSLDWSSNWEKINP